MPRSFHRMTVEEFAQLLACYRFTRQVNAVHLHHTWRPNHAQFRGEASIRGMWIYHTETNGWSDIAQHLTLDPEGFLWTGRDWNRPPASASGHNGNRRFGPFMIEMVGDFDRGHDPWEGAQRDAALKVVALLQERFRLPPDSLCFHRAMSGKTCPGTAIDRDEVIGEVTRLREEGGIPGSRAADAPEPDELPFDPSTLAARAALDRAREAMAQGARTGVREEAEGEPDCGEADEAAVLDAVRAAEGERTSSRGPTGGELEVLAPHVINLRMGRFSDTGDLATSETDVAALFDRDGPLEDAWAAARERDRPLRILLWAHGGLVSESAGLRGAYRLRRFFHRNGVHPLFFVWETGLLETLGQMLERVRSRSRAVGARDLWDHTTDPVVEAAARALRGDRIWGGMKRSAEEASAEGGGARYVAESLAGFCEDRSDVELHAVGHSAGSIFLAHFVPAALEAGAPGFRTVQLLAPAMDTELFRRSFGPLLADGIDGLTIYTMRRRLERADDVVGIYRKSLLYLVHHALEPEKDRPILGLEECLRRDPDLRGELGLDGPVDHAEVVWSETRPTRERGGSMATTHGGFDDDRATLTSVLLRVLGPDGDPDGIEPYDPEHGRDRWSPGDGVDWPAALGGEGPGAVRPGMGGGYGAPGPGVEPGSPAGPGLSPGGPAPAPGTLPTLPRPGPGGGRARRSALCVGIDRYRRSPLSGCVADARLWGETLEALGFPPPRMLLDGDATREAMVGALEGLLADSRAGDVLVFQFAGHGTTVPDLDGDEAGGDTPLRDEAMCPVDTHEGELLTDDDVRRLFEALPDGVNLTCFIDCCHSGTITRLHAGGRGPGGADVRARFLPPTPEMDEAFLRKRRGSRSGPPAREDGGAMRHVVFSACRSNELAYERNGQGDFTLRATRILRESGTGAMSHRDFQDRVTRAFGPNPRQHPEIDAAAPALERLLLVPLEDAGPAGSPDPASALPPHLLRALLHFLARYT